MKSNEPLDEIGKSLRTNNAIQVNGMKVSESSKVDPHSGY